MITNITINIQTDTPAEQPLTIDMSAPNASLFLDMLHDGLVASIPSTYSPDAPYDSGPFLAESLRKYSDDLKLHREDEYSANRQIRKAISEQALDTIAQKMKQLVLNDAAWAGPLELPEDFKKTLYEMDDVLRAVGTSWKETVEGLHKRLPMDEATMRKHLEHGCFPEELIDWKYDA